MIYYDGIPNIKDIDLHLSNNKKIDLNKNGDLLRHIPNIFTERDNFKKNVKKRNDCNCCNKNTIFYCSNCSNGLSNIKLCLQCFEKYHRDLFTKKKNKKFSNY